MIKLKHWYKSFTVWLGGVMIVISQIPPEMIEILHPDVKDWIQTLLGAALIYTRIFGTNQAVTVKAAMRPVAEDKVISN